MLRPLAITQTGPLACLEHLKSWQLEVQWVKPTWVRLSVIDTLFYWETLAHDYGKSIEPAQTKHPIKGGFVTHVFHKPPRHQKN